MANKIIFLILQFAIIINYQCDCDDIMDHNYQQGYYWKDYTGQPVQDAIQAGLNSHGQPIYIGQTPHLNNVIVGKVTQNEYTLYYEFYGLQHTTRDIKVLCTTTPNYFIWIPTQTDKLDFINEKYLVVGGYEPNRTLYIGRTFYNSETLVGKVVKTRGLYAVGASEVRFPTFEVLTYQPPINRGLGIDGVPTKIDIYTHQ